MSADVIIKNADAPIMMALDCHHCYEPINPKNPAEGHTDACFQHAAGYTDEGKRGLKAVWSPRCVGEWEV